jgi:hypothetical protein
MHQDELLSISPYWLPLIPSFFKEHDVNSYKIQRTIRSCLGARTSEWGENGRRVNIVEILCTHVQKWKK